MGRPPAAAAESEDRPFNWKVLFAVLLALGLPATVLIRVFWIHHTWGAIGVGFTLAYAVVLAMLWTGRAPREPKPPQPQVMTPEAWIYARLHTDVSLAVTVVNLGETPLRIPGLPSGAGLDLELLDGDRQVKRGPLLPPGADTSRDGGRDALEVPRTHYDFVAARFDPERSPSARTVHVDVRSFVAGVPPGRYDLRVRWDGSGLAGPGDWTPGTPVVLGMFPLTVRG